MLPLVLRGGSAVGRWNCDLQVVGSIPGRWLPRNIGQLNLPSLRAGVAKSSLSFCWG